MSSPSDESTDGGPHPVPGNGQGVEELARLSRTLRALSEGNRTLLRSSDESELLHEMCNVIVEVGGYRLAGVGYAESDLNKSIRWVASSGPAGTALRALPFTWADTPAGQTATGTAIRTGHAIIGRNVLTDPAYAGHSFAPLRQNALENGYVSVAAFPLRLNHAVLGALVMAAAEANAFDAEEVKLLGELADDLAYGIANLRTAVQNRAAQATIARLAYYDPLTNLPNRTLLLEQLEAALQTASQQSQSLALLHLEVGRFREINKVLGYRAGDDLLREIGRRLASTVQGSALLARVGETEFALLLENAGAELATHVAQQLHDSLREPVEVRSLLLDARVVIGIALFPDHASDADALIRRANAAMHQAQPAHGGYAMYTGGQEEEHTRRLALMGDLHWAIEHDELTLHCQPKVDIASRHVSGAEALVRWPHPLHGLISTQELIMIVEQAGMITPLTNWMLEAAFRQCHAWREAGLNQALAVNLSGNDLYDPELIDRIRGLFSTWGIEPSQVQFELTETALMTDPASAVETLLRLKRLNVELFVDDYGTGYSSLSYLQKLPIDGLKIDRSFVTPMDANGDSSVIVRSTIELGHNLGLKVVAEGVESQAVWERLAALGCDLAQGYLISKPMPAHQFHEWERAWS
ncbi:MAG: GGDEF domain-containing protein [Telluria sp.]|nr:GGDEF domain-containing protein [Telluria sp.]